MAAYSAKSVGSADSYIGCFLSLISKAEIRYEGFLFHINPQESIIGLRNVKSFGTEGRRKDGPQVLPSDKVYEYIFFRGSDIKDLQVISSPPVQSSSALPNDPAIIQPQYPLSTSASSSFLSANAVPATNISSSAQLGLPNSTFQGNLPLDQPVQSIGYWDSFPPPQFANGNDIPLPTYRLGNIGSSGGASYLQQQSSFQPPQSLPVFPPVQQQMQNPTTNASFPADTSNFAEFSSPMLPTFGSGYPGLASTMPPPPALPSSDLMRQSATLPSKLSPNLMPDNAPNALPTITLGSDFPMASPLMASSLDVNPVFPLVMDKPKPVCQTVSQSLPSIGGSFTPVHSEASIPPLLTPGQLLQPGLTRQYSPHLQTAHKDIEVVQASTSESLSLSSESAKNSAKPLPLPSAEKVNGSALHSHLTNKRHPQERRNMLNKTALHIRHSERDHARGKGNWLNGAALRDQHSYRGQARGRANRLNGSAVHPHQSTRNDSWGRENGPNTATVHTHRSDRGSGRGKGNQNSTAVHTHFSYRSHGHGKGNQVSRTVTKFTEDFDFEAMNEKFNKKEIWGHLGKTRLEDNEREENNNNADGTAEEDEDGLSTLDVKAAYIKDDFFDSLSCNSHNRESERGRPKLSEQRKLDMETFGEIPRRLGGHRSWGHGWGGLSGVSHRGRGYGYGGRGRARAVWSRVT